ncbi:MAG: MG2 domain-containing protein [Thermoguttaceae bacterium]
MNTSSEPLPPQAVLKPSLTVVRQSGPAAKLMVGVAAFALVAVSIAGYFYHRFQMAAIAAEHLRLMVTGPSTLQAGAAAQFDIRTTEVTAAPVSVPVEVDLLSPDGKILIGRKESTDQQGRLQVSIPADMYLPADVILKVMAAHRGSPEQMSAPLAVYPALLATQISLDKPLYQPGETIYYRSLSLSRFGLAVDREIPIHYEILDPAGATLPNSRTDGTTDHGVGNGTYNIPDDLPGGQYTILVRSSDESFPEEKRKFLIRRYRPPRLKKDLVFLSDSYAPGDTVAADFSVTHSEGGPAIAAKLHLSAYVDGQSVLEKDVQPDKAGTFRIELKLPEKITRGDGQLAVTVSDGGARETIAKAIPINLGKVDVHFYPEGGDLAAGLENRVYFVCQDPLGKPLRISGVVVNENGRTMAAVESIREGMGQFSFTSQPGESYRLKIIAPAGIKDEPKLPAAVADCPIVLTTGTGAFGPSEMLEFNIRSSKAGLPLVVGAWCRGVMAGQVALVTKKSENGLNPVALPLPDEVGGVIRLTVFDYSINLAQSNRQFPKPLAERLVYRCLDRRLNVRAIDCHEHYAPGEKVNMSLAVTNEKNEPVAAALGVSVVDQALFALAGDHTPTMTTQFLLTSEIDNHEDLENADFYISEDKSSTVPAAVALDLLLGTQGWRRFSGDCPDFRVNENGTVPLGLPETNRSARLPALSGQFGPPIMYDNLSRIRYDYQKSLSTYYADRSQALYTIVTICFLGAWGLLLLVFMLGLLRIVRGAAFWLPVLGMIVCCSFIGALLMDPLRSAGENDQAVPFLSYQAPTAKPAAKNDLKSGKKSNEEKTADNTAAQRVPLAQPVPPPRRSETAAALSSPSPQLEQVVPRSNSARGEKTVSGPTEPAKTEHFIVRQYAHQHVAAQPGARDDTAESLFWNPLLIAGADGKLPVSFDLPDSITSFRLQADANGAARIGSLRMEISTQIPVENNTK